MDKKRRGSMTIEAAVVLPLVTIALFILIFLSMFAYSRVIASSVINQTANRIVAEWNSNSQSDFSKYKNPEGSKVFSMYFSSNAQNAKAAITTFIVDKVKKTVPMEVDVNVSLNLENLLIAETFTITTKCTYKYPLGSMFEFMGLEGKISDTYIKNVIVSDSKETIRTIRYAKGLVERITSKKGMFESIGGSEVIEKIHGFFSSKK